ncbi:MAG TPA: CpsB/CapC family capsule biosynthesis tyrosine phosphatase [Flavobacterium sp.]|nr:CpsB/CapC family capsule biosynthesis tyrosine phosphatase [Flavobacterium sp.]
MFKLFKSKPQLKELIPTNSFDFHSHVLYGLDDGAKTIEDTLFLINSLIELGFSELSASPHTTPLVWENTKEGILAQYEKIKEEILELSQQVQLRTASEYLMDESFLQRMQSEKLLTIKDNYVLVEMSYINPPMGLYDILFQLKSEGYQPVLAHPERYNFYKNDLESFRKLKKYGCLFQLNILSTTGYYGDGIAEVADYLLKENMYDFAATDVHHNKHIEAFQSKVKVRNYQSIEKLLENNNVLR